MAIDKIFLISFLCLAASFALAGGVCAKQDPFDVERQEMVDEQIKARGLTSSKVVAAMEKVKRHLFVPKNLQGTAYDDTPLPIGYSQTISQPYIVAYMTDAAKLSPEDRVLEIGTGSGYQAAILAEIAKEVYSIEIIKPLAERADALLKELGYNNIKVKYGDGFKGWPEFAPFDAIIVTAAPEYVPEELVKQLKVGGRMVVPMGSFFQDLYLITKTESGITQKRLLPVKFVPMVRSEK